MTTIQQAVIDILKRNPLFQDALAEGIANYSSLARKIQPLLEKQELKSASEGATVMALKRYYTTLSKQEAHYSVPPIRNMVVRSNLVEVAFENSANLTKVHKELLHEAAVHEDSFFNFAQGVFETTIIVHENLQARLEALTKNEKRLAVYKNLSAVSIRLPAHTADTPGLYYPFFKALALEGINFVELISVFSELTFLFEDHQIDRAFAIFKRLTKQ
ncbi:hypothetical protein COV82_01665 [Candidatus Peregrinibacteria bacterium CG11_big_fil_rev_8_21_14_0_20_46_8]|nr:MAG: hypothetical protein COV82_01665 [Candidatus Peregrinibacteria bacterium CG11_big_fil_rev_8_21_14_0_20_46_8]